MKTSHTLTILIWAGCLIICACSKSKENITNPPSDSNLLTNGSFELNGVASLQGWTPSTTDTGYVNFSSDVPQNAGSVSLKLRNEWTFAGSVSQLIGLPIGTHRYQLTASAKALRTIPTMNAGGDMRIMVKQAGFWSTSKWLYFSDTTWVSGTLIDTLTISQGDTIAVILRGDYHQFSFGYILFDSLNLERLD